MKVVHGLILDFDGTLAPAAPEIALRILHDLLSRWKPVPLAFVRQYLRTASAFRMGPALEFFLDSLGLGDHLDEVGEAFATAEGHGTLTMDLDPGAAAFIQRRAGRVKVFSSAGVHASRFSSVSGILKPSDFLSYSGFPKSDPDTYRRIARDLNIDPGRWVCVDDSPIALWSAKTAGFLTVMRLNSLFSEVDFQEYSSWIDYRVRSLSDLDRRFKGAT